jgi:hypothetical protein
LALVYLIRSRCYAAMPVHAVASCLRVGVWEYKEPRGMQEHWSRSGCLGQKRRHRPETSHSRMQPIAIADRARAGQGSTALASPPQFMFLYGLFLKRIDYAGLGAKIFGPWTRGPRRPPLSPRRRAGPEYRNV